MCGSSLLYYNPNFFRFKGFFFWHRDKNFDILDTKIMFTFHNICMFKFLCPNNFKAMILILMHNFCRILTMVCWY